MAKIWQVARDRYMSGLSEEEQNTFKKAFSDTDSVDRIISVAKDIGSHKFSEKLNSLLGPLRELAPIFDVISNVNGMIGCSIWVPLKLIIQVRLSGSLYRIHT